MVKNYQAKYFNIKEFDCKCGFNCISPKLLYKLDKLRDDCGFAFIVTSGCRCVKHNIEVGGAVNSAHLQKNDGYSHAADIKVIGSYKRMIFVKNALKYFNRIGIGDCYIHVDIYEPNGKDVLWIY